ncbi:hypothetical protein M3210_11050 [Oceanobacillus luteolus]|uniref:Uncharacterized protein n=1 Tax=Oceanobacillus luteolus TaxID=1274358 RepID=A0ABW4HV53_9BACI|nr:hypothetical protein [Oceanobacillus luteolus]
MRFPPLLIQRFSLGITVTVAIAKAFTIAVAIAIRSNLFSRGWCQSIEISHLQFPPLFVQCCSLGITVAVAIAIAEAFTIAVAVTIRSNLFSCSWRQSIKVSHAATPPSLLPPLFHGKIREPL